MRMPNILHRRVDPTPSAVKHCHASTSVFSTTAFQASQPWPPDPIPAPRFLYAVLGVTKRPRVLRPVSHCFLPLSPLPLPLCHTHCLASISPLQPSPRSHHGIIPVPSRRRGCSKILITAAPRDFTEFTTLQVISYCPPS